MTGPGYAKLISIALPFLLSCSEISKVTRWGTGPSEARRTSAFPSTSLLKYETFGPKLTSETDYEYFKRAIAYAKQYAVNELRIPRGDYFVVAPLKQPHIKIWGMTDFLLDGQGSTIQFATSEIGSDGFSLKDCERVAIENFTVNFPEHTSSLADVVLRDGKKALRLRSPYSELVAKNPKNQSVVDLHMAVDRGTTENVFSYGATQVFYADSIRKFKYESGGFFTPDPPNLLDNWPENQLVFVQHRKYIATAFLVKYGKNIAIRNNIIHHVPGMGVIAIDMQGLTIEGNTIVATSDGIHRVSLEADGFHISACSNVQILRNIVSRIGDDFVNVHSMYYTLKSVLGDVIELEAENIGAHFKVSPGETLMFKTATLNHVGSAKIKAVDMSQIFSPDHLIRATLETVPAGLSVGQFVYNTRHIPRNIQINENRFAHTVGRGLLLQGQDIQVTDNLIRGTLGAAIRVSPGVVYFREGPGTRNLVITGNQIINAMAPPFQRNAYVTQLGAISLSSEVRQEANDPYSFSRAYVHFNAEVSNNTFEGIPGVAIQVSSTDGAKVTGNHFIETNTEDATILNTGASAGRFAGNCPVRIFSAHAVTLLGNVWDNKNSKCVSSNFEFSD